MVRIIYGIYKCTPENEELRTFSEITVAVFLHKITCSQNCNNFTGQKILSLKIRQSTCVRVFLFGCCSHLLNTICRLFVDHGFKDQAVRLQVNMYELCQGCILVVGTIDEN